MDSDNSKTIKKVKVKLSQVEARLLAQKRLERNKDTQEKKSLGKVFLLSGIGTVTDIKNLNFQNVIILGGLAKKLNLHHYKLSQYLGSVAAQVNVCKINSTRKSEYTKAGKTYLDDNEISLPSPYPLFMGILLNAKSYLTTTENQESAHLKGDYIFHHFRELKRTERIQKVKLNL